MATGTLGTNTTTTLTSILWKPGTFVSAADMRTIQQAILNDINPHHPVWPGAFSNEGLLFIPNRGLVKVLPGDYVAVDATGWPILVSANAIASISPASSWTHS